MASDRDLKITISAKDLASKAFKSIKTAVSGLNTETKKTASSLAKMGLAYNPPIKKSGQLKTAVNSLSKRMQKIRPIAAKMFAGFAGKLKSIASEVFSLRTAFVALAGAAGIGFLAKSLIRTASSFEDLGTQLTALQGSARAGREAVEWIKGFAKATPLSLEEVTEAFVRAKALGLDPMDGTLQSLVDVNAKLAGSGQKLISITRAVGEMFTKGTIQAQEMTLQLTNAGVPAWDLLSKAMNRANNTTEFTIARLREMGEKGELGRKEVKLLIDEMGRFGEGAALARMKDFAGLSANLGDEISKAKDEFTRAKNGLFDFTKALIAEGITSIERFRKEGSLAKWGEDAAFAMIDASKAVIQSTILIVKLGETLIWMATPLTNTIGFFLVLGKVTKDFVDSTISAIKTFRRTFKGELGDAFDPKPIEDTTSSLEKLLSKFDELESKIRKRSQERLDREALEKATGISEKPDTALEEQAKAAEEANKALRITEIENESKHIDRLIEINRLLAESKLNLNQEAINKIADMNAEAAESEISRLKNVEKQRESNLKKQIELIDLETSFLGKGAVADLQREVNAERRLELEKQIAIIKAERLGADPLLVFEISQSFEEKKKQIFGPTQAQQQEEEAAANALFRQTEFDNESAHLQRLIELDQKVARLRIEQGIELKEEQITALAEMDEGAASAELNRLKELEEAKRALRASSASNTLSAAGNLFNAMFILGGQKSKRLFEITKALNIAEAITSTFSAATKALNSPPGPPFTIPLAAAVTAAGLANVARIRATQFGGGGGGGGGIPQIGASPGGQSTFPAGRQDKLPVDVRVDIISSEPEKIDIDRLSDELTQSISGALNVKDRTIEVEPAIVEALNRNTDATLKSTAAEEKALNVSPSSIERENIIDKSIFVERSDTTQKTIVNRAPQNIDNSVKVEKIEMNIKTDGEPIDWDQEAENLAESLGNHLNKGGSLGPIETDIFVRN